jgi:hypothetical protein
MPTHLVINSADRQSGGTASEFRVSIPSFYGTGLVALLSASIPNTLYNISSATNNNTIYWSRAATPYSATLSDGAYAVTDLLTALPAAMNNADAGGVYSATYNTVTMKLTITSTDATFSLTLSNRTNAAWNNLGFQSTTNTAGALSQVGDSVIRLDFPAHLYIDISLPGQDVVNTSWVRANYLVPMTNISQYVEVYNRASTFDQLQCYSLGNGVSSLYVRLLRPDGSVAQLNGGEWSFVLGVEIN